MVERRWLKLWGKEIAARALAAARFPEINAARQRIALGGRRLLVVSFHRVVESYAQEVQRAIPGLLISQAALRRQLEQIARRYEVVPLGRALEELRWLRRGSDLAAITFDDGYADVHDVALPVLRSLKIASTVFLATGFVGTDRRMPHDRLFAALQAVLDRRGAPLGLPAGPARESVERFVQSRMDAAATVDALLARLPERPLLELIETLERRAGLTLADLPAGSRLLSWKMAQELAREGHAVGAHTVHHRVLPNLPLASVREELEASRRAIFENVGVWPTDFAYPNGWYNRRVVAEVVAAGFHCAVTTEARFNGPGGDPFRLGRYTLWEGSSLGPAGYSDAIAARQLDGSFSALGIPRVVCGQALEQPFPTVEEALEPAALERGPGWLPARRRMHSFPRPEGADAGCDGSLPIGP